MRTIPGQIGHNSGQIVPAGYSVDMIESPDGALTYARNQAGEVVSMRASRRGGNKEIAVYELTREYKFGSWLASLLKTSKKPTVHLHYIIRLQRALDREVEAQEARIAHHKTMRGQTRAAIGLHSSLDEERGPGFPGQTCNPATTV